MENGGIASGAAVIWNLNTGALAVSGVAGAVIPCSHKALKTTGMDGIVVE
jgi:hypothetical protein